MQINKQNIDNSECFIVKFVAIYPEMISQEFFEKDMVLVDYIGIFFTFPNTFDRCVYIYILLPFFLP